jgi:hypothetical protein
MHDAAVIGAKNPSEDGPKETAAPECRRRNVIGAWYTREARQDSKPQCSKSHPLGARLSSRLFPYAELPVSTVRNRGKI